MHALRGGAPSLEALVRAVVRAVASRDTLGLRRLALDRAEFGWLVYPTSPYVAPPYRQAPWLVWFQIAVASEKGLARLLDRHGGWRGDVVGYTCANEPERHGVNRLWRRCRVRLRAPSGDTTSHRVFGDVIERGGRFKIVSYANDL